MKTKAVASKQSEGLTGGDVSVLLEWANRNEHRDPRAFQAVAKLARYWFHTDGKGPDQKTALIILAEASQLAISALLGDDPDAARMVEKFNRALELARKALKIGE